MFFMCKEVCVHMIRAVSCSVCWVMCKKVCVPVVGALMSLLVLWHGACVVCCIVFSVWHVISCVCMGCLLCNLSLNYS